MTSVSADPAFRALLTNPSLEMTGKDVPSLEEAAPSIPPGTRVNVTFLGNEDLSMRLAASTAVLRLGFVPVPHISARRLPSEQVLREFLTALTSAGAHEDVFVVAGDPATPEGPYDDALSLIRSGLLAEHGVRHVSIAGYPEGHPGIPGDVLWKALEDKATAVRETGTPGTVITQFGFDAEPVLNWIEAVRGRGITLPIRVGVPGPAGIRRLLSYAARFGVGTSAGIAKKYGFSITNLMGTTGPDRFIEALAQAYRPERHGEVGLHFYTFGGLRATSEWIGDYTRGRLG